MQESYQRHPSRKRYSEGKSTTSPERAVLDVRKLCFILNKNQEVARYRGKEHSLSERDTEEKNIL